MSRLTRFSWIAILAAVLLPTAAFAQVSLMPDGSDKSVTIFLNQLFGSLVSAAGGPGGGVDPLAASLGKLNEILLLVGGILLAYTLVAGTMQTAHDGEMLGKKWSSMWTPIRTSLGIAAIVPYLNGYALIQVVVMWLVLQGIGGANLVWKTFVSMNTNTQTQSTNSTNVAGLTPFAENMLKTLVCTYSVEAQLNGLQGDGGAFVGNANYQGILVPAEVTTASGGKRWTAEGFGETGCGGYDKALTFTSGFTGMTGNGVVVAPTSKYAADIEPIRIAHENATKKMIEKLKPMARAIAYSNESPGLGYQQIAEYYKMQPILDEYKSTVLAASANSMQSQQAMNEIKTNIAKDGWVTAGAWYVEWSRVNAEIRAQVGDVPSYISGTSSVFESSGLAAVIETNLGTKLPAVLKNQNYTDRFGVVDRNETLTSMGDNSQTTGGYVWNKITGLLFGSSWLHAIQDVNKKSGETTAVMKDPIVVAESLGNVLLTGSSAVLVASAVTGNTVLKALTVDVQMLLFSVGLPMMVFAMTLAYYIPFVPFIVWFGGVVGWLVMVVEAIIAAPLWAVAHLHPDGDGIVGRGGQGYSLILSLVLRPALMIIGLAASMVLMLPIGYFLHSVFLPAFELSKGGATSLFGMIALVAIYTTFLINIVNKVVGLMHVVPDQILRWIGGPSSDLGSYGQQANQGMQAAAGGFLGASGGKMIEGVRGMQQIKATRKGTEAQEKETALTQSKIASAASDRISGMENSIGTGYGMAHAVGETAKEKAVGAATKSLRAESKNKPKEEQFDNLGENEKAQAVWKQVKKENGNQNPSEIYDTAAKDAFNAAKKADTKGKILSPAIGANETFGQRVGMMQSAQSTTTAQSTEPDSGKSV